MTEKSNLRVVAGREAKAVIAALQPQALAAAQLAAEKRMASSEYLSEAMGRAAAAALALLTAGKDPDANPFVAKRLMELALHIHGELGALDALRLGGPA